MIGRLSEVNHVTMELTPELQEKKIFLIEGLKRTYKGQYDAIQPLPYIKDRLYCVDKVFVEGGVEVCLTPELTRGTGGSWERLESYKSIYTDFRFKSTRRIIQGEPGYGKSTLTLQLAYDWCNDVSDSPINNVEILILLRLRQLGSVKSLFRAIKSFLLFSEPRVSKHEIEKIINSCSSVHITLDGYDEYPGRGSDDNDYVHRIINMELFADFDVSLTTRYLPDCLREETKRAKLTGFDDKARDEYIRKAVVGNNDEAVETIKQRLYENSILADLCQVPLIFVMFAHMAHDQRDFMKFKSVTQFFKHTIRCFYDHLKRKRKLYDDRNNRFYLHEMEHHELDKIAFEGLNKKNQQLSWIKTEFRERVGPESYHQYISIGILVEEDVLSDDSTVDKVLFTTMVRFYHKLFCEWYAAHHLVTLVKNAYNINQTLRFLDPFDLQYLFRFACGLDPDAGKKLINHLKSLPGGDTFAILCILEQTGDIKDIMGSVKDLCSRDIKIKRGDSALLQRSTTQLLEIASKNNIPISCLHLKYSSIKFEGDTLILSSGIPLPILPTVEKIHIDGSNKSNGNTGTLTDSDLLNLLHYGLKCGCIKELMFGQLQMPNSVSPEAFTDIMKTWNIQVRWRPFDIDFHLDLQSGHWEVVDIQVLENIRCSTVSIDGRHSVLQQRSTVQLLHVAHRHNISISSLLFNESFKTADNGTIILNTGIRITNLPPLQKIHDVDNNGCNAITDQDIANILLCVTKGQHSNEICFEGWLMPVSLSSAFTNWILSLALNVLWHPFDKDFRLDLQTGHWEVVDNQVMEHICDSTVSIDGTHSKLQQRSTVQLLHVAHRHKIPICSLLFSKSFKTTDNGTIILNNGIQLTKLPPLQKIHDVDNNRYNAITDQDIANILLCVTKGQHFNEICFEGWLMPVSLSSAFTNWMLSLALNVLWRPFDNYFRLDLQTGHWEVVDNQVMEHIRCSTVSIDGEHSVLQQRSTVQLLHVAHNHNIPISSLLFNESFNTTAHKTIISNNGIQLTNLPPVQKIHVVNMYDCNSSEITEQDIVSILLCAMKDQHFNVLCFEGCRLPVSVSSSSITKTMISRAINVLWCPFDSVFHLDLQTGLWEVDDFEAIRDSFSQTFSINDSDTGLQHRSKVQLLYIAANHDTPISCVHVNKCVERYGEESFLLQSQVLLAPVTTVQHICIEKGMGTKKMKKIRNTDMESIFHFGMKCQQLKDISFRSCMLSLDNLSNYIPSNMKGRNIRVTWPEGGYRLNLQTGDWEVADLDPIRALCTKKVRISSDDSQALQRDAIRLLENAAKYDIPITCLYLKKSFSYIYAGNIILESGLHLSCPASVKKVVIDTEERRNMTEKEVVDILMFVQQSNMLEELEFNGCVLPLTFSSESIPAELRSRNIEVSWSNYGCSLNLQSGLWEVNEDVVRKRCTKDIYIRRDDSELLQRCTMQLLENASNYDIPISCLYLKGSFSKIDAGNVVLHSGLRLSCPVSVKKVVLDTERGREMTETEVVDILMFVQQSHMLKKLEFDGCLLPLTFSSESISAELQSRNIKVFWSNNGCSLDLQSGIWKVNEDVVRKRCTKDIYIQRHDSDLLQRCTMQLLENASNYGIPISCLYLDESFSKIDAGEVILHSGLRLSCPATVKKVVIQTEKGREMTETEVVDILMFVQQSHMLKKLEFEWCLLPLYIPAESIPSILKSRNVKVAWQMHHTQFQLNLQSGQWMDDQVLSKSLSSMLMINKEGGRLDIPGTRASLEIPSGALEGEQLIQMIIIPAHLEDESLTFASNSSLVVELLPSNVNLLKPAILTLPHCLVLKKGCEWKAKIYRSHHKEGSEPQWEEQFSTCYELGEHNCVIKIQRFSWEKFVVLDKIVEAKNIIVYASGRCGPSDSMYLDIGYYWDLATCEEVSKLNNAKLLHKKPTIFYNDGRGLNISLKKFKPKNWKCSNKETKTQMISFDEVAINKGTFCTFELDKTDERDECTCLFKAGQAPNLKDYTFLLKHPSSVTQPSPTNIQGDARAGRATAGIPASDRIVTNATIQDPSSVTQPSTTNIHGDARAGRSTAGIPASDCVVTNATIQDLSHKLCREWMIVGRELGIEEPKLQAIDTDNKTAQGKVYEMLLKWKQSKGNEATYRLLGEALKSTDRKDLQEYLYQQV